MTKPQEKSREEALEKEVLIRSTKEILISNLIMAFLQRLERDTQVDHYVMSAALCDIAVYKIVASSIYSSEPNEYLTFFKDRMKTLFEKSEQTLKESGLTDVAAMIHKARKEERDRAKKEAH